MAPNSNSDDSNVYGFTTTREDNYFKRVLDEAKPEAKFILITHKDVQAHVKKLVLFVRKNILNIADKYPTLTLATMPLSGWLELALTVDADWLMAVQMSDRETDQLVEALSQEVDLIEEAIAREEAIREQEFRQAKNLAEGRVVRVTVETR